MRYPYIGKGSRSGAVFLFLSEGDGFVLEQGFSSFTGRMSNIVETLCRNITAEYLANTYGEVKSKEHAEFIVKLAEVNKVVVCDVYRDSHKFFAVIDSSLLFFNSGAIAMKDGRKQITIPLPPECEEKIYRYEGMGNNPKHLDCVCNKCGGRCCIGNCDEWPKVGDEVTWGAKAVSGEVKAIDNDNDNDFAWVKNDYGNYVTVYVGHLEKPKTPEQKLQEDLINIFQSSLDGGHFVGKLMAKYNITKKGEGDE